MQFQTGFSRESPLSFYSKTMIHAPAHGYLLYCVKACKPSDGPPAKTVHKQRYLDP